jgi:hypothetical protein
MPTTKSAELVKNTAKLRALLEPQRAGYTNAVFTELRRQFDAFRTEMENAYFDEEILAPYSSRISRREAQHRQHLREQCRRWTKASESAVPAKTAWFDNPVCTPYRTYGIKGAHPRYFRPQEVINAELRAEAEQITNHDFDAYAAKLAGKIGLPITSAELTGQLWNYSFLQVEVEEGGEKGSQVWKTQMILNVSYLGKLFNQWPTRLVG